MKVAFRVDASLQMGTGHVMRCLTLAENLKQRGATCQFICRDHPGNLFALVRQRGFKLIVLPREDGKPGWGSEQSDTGVGHEAWLACDWRVDAEQTVVAIDSFQPDWLVVDHYAIDRAWEEVVRPHTGFLMVIDDLADRFHVSDLLLDQNLGREPLDYTQLIPAQSVILTGPKFALLRPEFASLRSQSLRRRSASKLGKILITMGGVDQPNATGQVLKTLSECELPLGCQVSVVLGAHSPWLAEVQELAQAMPVETQVLFNVDDMGQRMADCDLAIGAAGITSWERGCLGLPSLIVILADNQRPGAAALESTGAAKIIGEVADIELQLPRRLVELLSGGRIAEMSHSAAEITDGLGTERVAQLMEKVLSR